MECDAKDLNVTEFTPQLRFVPELGCCSSVMKLEPLVRLFEMGGAAY